MGSAHDGADGVALATHSSATARPDDGVDPSIDARTVTPSGTDPRPPAPPLLHGSVTAVAERLRRVSSSGAGPPPPSADEAAPPPPARPRPDKVPAANAQLDASSCSSDAFAVEGSAIESVPRTAASTPDPAQRAGALFTEVGRAADGVAAAGPSAPCAEAAARELQGSLAGAPVAEVSGSLDLDCVIKVRTDRSPPAHDTKLERAAGPSPRVDTTEATADVPLGAGHDGAASPVAESQAVPASRHCSDNSDGRGGAEPLTSAVMGGSVSADGGAPGIASGAAAGDGAASSGVDDRLAPSARSVAAPVAAVRAGGAAAAAADRSAATSGVTVSDDGLVAGGGSAAGGVTSPPPLAAATGQVASGVGAAQTAPPPAYAGPTRNTAASEPPPEDFAAPSNGGAPRTASPHPPFGLFGLPQSQETTSGHGQAAADVRAFAPRSVGAAGAWAGEGRSPEAALQGLLSPAALGELLAPRPPAQPSLGAAEGADAQIYDALMGLLSGKDARPESSPSPLPPAASAELEASDALMALMGLGPTSSAGRVKTRRLVDCMQRGGVGAPPTRHPHAVHADAGAQRPDDVFGGLADSAAPDRTARMDLMGALQRLEGTPQARTFGRESPPGDAELSFERWHADRSRSSSAAATPEALGRRPPGASWLSASTPTPLDAPPASLLGESNKRTRDAGGGVAYGEAPPKRPRSPDMFRFGHDAPAAAPLRADVADPSRSDTKLQAALYELLKPQGRATAAAPAKQPWSDDSLLAQLQQMNAAGGGGGALLPGIATALPKLSKLSDHLHGVADALGAQLRQLSDNVSMDQLASMLHTFQQGDAQHGGAKAGGGVGGGAPPVRSHGARFDDSAGLLFPETMAREAGGGREALMDALLTASGGGGRQDAGRQQQLGSTRQGDASWPMSDPLLKKLMPGVSLHQPTRPAVPPFSAASAPKATDPFFNLPNALLPGGGGPALAPSRCGGHCFVTAAPGKYQSFCPECLLCLEWLAARKGVSLRDAHITICVRLAQAHAKTAVGARPAATRPQPQPRMW